MCGRLHYNRSIERGIFLIDDRGTYRPIGTRALSADEQAAIEQLLAICNQHEGIVLPLEFDDEGPSAHVPHWLVFHEQTLIGYAGLRVWSAVEFSGMVHPAHRRKGVGRALLAAVLAESNRAGKPALLVLDEAAGSGRAFATAVGARFRFAEHRMLLDQSALDRSRTAPPGFAVRSAGLADIDALAQVQAAAFDDPEELTRRMVEEGLHQLGREYLIAELNGTPIGSLRIGRYAQSADITAFGVVPEQRGRGYGRQLLLTAVQRLADEGHAQIAIDVETDNTAALGLYRSCGFRVTTSYGYYGFVQA